MRFQTTALDAHFLVERSFFLFQFIMGLDNRGLLLNLLLKDSYVTCFLIVGHLRWLIVKLIPLSVQPQLVNLLPDSCIYLRELSPSDSEATLASWLEEKFFECTLLDKWFNGLH